MAKMFIETDAGDLGHDQLSDADFRRLSSVCTKFVILFDRDKFMGGVSIMFLTFYLVVCVIVLSIKDRYEEYRTLEAVLIWLSVMGFFGVFVSFI